MSEISSSRDAESAGAGAKDNAVQQAQQWAQEARTQRAIVLDILRYFGLPERDWEALRLIRQHIEAIAESWDGCHCNGEDVLSEEGYVSEDHAQFIVDCVNNGKAVRNGTL